MQTEKEKIKVVVYLDEWRVEGDLHVLSESRLTDALNARMKDFLAITDATIFDAKTGEKVWDQRLKGPGAKTGTWSSLLVADGKIYVPNQSGDVFVLRAGPKFDLLATNSVNEPTNASLAVSDGDLFFRTDKGLWCLANAK